MVSPASLNYYNNYTVIISEYVISQINFYQDCVSKFYNNQKLN